MGNTVNTGDDGLESLNKSITPHAQLKSITEGHFEYYKTIVTLGLFLEEILDKNSGDPKKIWPIFDQIRYYLNSPNIKNCMESLIDNKGMITLNKNLEHIFYGNYNRITKNGIVGKSVENILRLQ